MSTYGEIRVTGLNQWMDLTGVTAIEGMAERCCGEYLQEYLAAQIRMRDVEVVKAEVNTSGSFKAPNLLGTAGKYFASPEYQELPDFCEIELRHRTGKYFETIWVWVPLRWNGRFWGCCGGGNRTAIFMEEGMYNGMRYCALPIGIRNGFACAASDGGNREDENFGWGVDFKTGEFSRELYENWIDYSTHNMSILGKAVTEALTGEAPAYSYILGGSGGGRQVLAEAQNHPEDYDGYWSDAPCVSYNRMLLALSWPYVVMNTYGNTLTPAKFKAFQEEVFDKAGGREAFYNTTERIEYDAANAIGKDTPDGKLTELDALVMNKIWEGPRTEDGEFLWYGMRPGVSAWEGIGYALVTEVEGRWQPVNFTLNNEYIRNWIERDPNYKLEDIDIREYTRLHIKCQELFADMDSESPDLRQLRDLGGKMILCHGVDDDAIYVDGTIAYYDKVVNLFGSKEAAKEVCRLLVVPGDGHCAYSKYGAGPSTATAMEALMNWVEKGMEPETIRGQRYDTAAQAVAEEKDTPIW